MDNALHTMVFLLGIESNISTEQQSLHAGDILLPKHTVSNITLPSRKAETIYSELKLIWANSKFVVHNLQ